MSSDKLEVTEEPRSDELRERASKPKSSRLDATLGGLEGSVLLFAWESGQEIGR